MKNIFKALLVAFVAIIFAACGSADSGAKSGLEAIKAAGKIRVGVFSDKPPFGFINADGKEDGFDVFIAKELAKNLLGDVAKAEFVHVEAASRVEFLKSGKVDVIMANFTKTPERAQVVDFAAPYMNVALGVVSKGGEITDLSQLAGKTLIVNKGTTADFYFSKNHPEVKLLKFDQNTETFQALKDGRGDALAHDNLLVFAWVKENADFAVGIGTLGDADVIAPAVAKGNSELLGWLNSQISDMNKNGFMDRAYDATLSAIYGNEQKASVLVK